MTSSDVQHERERLAFVIMPFDLEFNGIYQDLIVPALEEAGFEVRRADSDLNQRSILKDIVEYIIRADLIIAELSSLNGNVMYELGIAHSLAKPTILLTQDIAVIPFDLRSYRLLTYSLNYNEVRKLQEQLKEIAVRHRQGLITFGNPVSDFAPRDILTSYSMAGSVSSIVRQGEIRHQQDNAQVLLGEGLQAEEEELGILDLEEDIERSQQDITDYMNRLTDITKYFESSVASYLGEMQALSNTPSTTARKRELVRAVAGEIGRYAGELEGEIPRLRDAWERFGESSNKAASMAHLIGENDRESARSLILGATGFETTVMGVVATIEETNGSLIQLKGISKDLNRAVRQVEQALSHVAEIFSIGASYAARIGSIVEERLTDSPEASTTRH